MAGRRRLLGEDVHRGAGDAALAQRPGQRRLVHRGPAPDVDEVGRRLHARELTRADHPLRLGRQRGRHHDHVGALQQLGQSLGTEPGLRQPPLGIAGAGRAIVGIGALRRMPLERDDAHAEGGGRHARQLAADAAVADDAEGGAAHLGRHEQRPALRIGRPAAARLPLDHAWHTVGQGQQHGQRVLGDGAGMHAARRGQRQRARRVERMVVQRVDARHVELDPLERGRAAEIARRQAGVEDLHGRVIRRVGLSAGDRQRRRHAADAVELGLGEAHGDEDAGHER